MTTTAPAVTPSNSFLPIPDVFRHLFDSFPLITYPSPAPPAPSVPTLHVFAADAATDAPSFNPTCLKWQAYLKFRNIRVLTVASNNHASPTGALPFLITTDRAVISSTKIPAWAGDNAAQTSVEEKAFAALVNTRVREAWLFSLYLEPRNFEKLAVAQYRSTGDPIVHRIIRRELRSEVEAELVKIRPGCVVDGDDIYADAEAALEALSTVLGEEDAWFFGAEEPGLMDAAVFGYTHLILTLPWHEAEARLSAAVRRWENLVRHEERVRARCGW